MKRIHLANLAASLGLASTSLAAVAQAPEAPADFGPPAPATELQQPAPPTLSTPEVAPAQRAPDATDLAPRVSEPAPLADETPPVGETRRAAPDAPPPAARDANAQTGPYLGHGLFNNWGPNDFGS